MGGIFNSGGIITAIPGTVTVSGTVTANAGTNLNTSALALDATLTNKTQFAKITDGTDTALVTAAGEVNVLATAQPGVDIGDVTINNATGAAAVNIQDGGNSITVDGTVTANAGSGTFTVSGTVTANAGTGTFTTADSQVITDNAPFTDGTSKVFVGGYIFDEAAGTALTENDAAASRVDSKRAQVLVIEDETTRGRRTTVTAANALKVDGSAVTQPVSGTVSITANSAVNVAQVAGGTTSTVATGVQKVAIADSGGTAFLSAANALNSTGGGVQAVQVVGQFDDSSPTSITENQFGNLRMSANRNLYSTIRDAAGNERGANVNSSSQLSVSVDNSNVSANIAQMNGVAVTMGNGASGTGVQRVTIASDSTGTTAVTQATGTNLHMVVDSGTITTVSTVTAVTAITNALPTGTNTIGGVKTVPDATSTYAPTNATSTAYEASRVVKASAGVLQGLSGYNSRTSAQFIQLHNAASLPADTAVPVVVFRVGPSSNFTFDSGRFGRYFSTGIVITNSSTAPTKTIGSADCWFDVQYT